METSDNEEMNSLYASSSSSLNQPFDWDDLTDVVQPIPAYMESILAEMRRRYERSEICFCGDVALLRWRRGMEEFQTGFHAPDEEDAQDNAFYVGRHWTPYEKNGSLIREHSPAWYLFLEIGVVKADIEAGGMQFLIQLKSFPAEPFRESLYNQHHLVTSMDEWIAFKRDVLDGVVGQLLERIEDEVEFGFSEDSTEAYSEDDHSEMDVESDAGEM
jgi:hypothetical protein